MAGKARWFSRLSFSALLLMFVFRANAASVSGSFTVGCIAGTVQCIPGSYYYGTIGGDPAFSSPDYSASLDQPLYSVHYDASSSLSFVLHPDNLHAYLDTSATLLDPSNIAVSGISRGYADLSATVQDALNFSSSTLAPGSDVTFTITGTLHSVFSSNLPSRSAPCDPTADETNAFAGMTINGIPTFPAGTWYHSACGDGSDLMTAVETFHSTVGGQFGITTQFTVMANAAVQFPTTGSYYTTADASNTATIFVTVLTPGVTFTSDSGASYAQPSSVPEPGSLLLMGAGMIGLAGAFSRKRRMRI